MAKSAREIVRGAKAKRTSTPAAKVSSEGHSMAPEAVRARARRAAARAAKANAPAATLTPELLKAERAKETPRAQASPDPITGNVVRSGPVPLDDARRAAAARSLAGLLTMVCLLWAKLAGDDRIRLPKDDAAQTADLCIDAWPELADVDAGAWLAIGTLASLGVERVRYTKESMAKRKPVARTVAPAPEPEDHVTHAVGATGAGWMG